MSITCWRYEAKLRTDNAQIEVDLIALSESHKRWGFGLIYLHLRNVQGKTWNHKRIYRIYRQLALNLRIKPRDCDTFGIKRTRPEPLNVPSNPNGVWSMDFMHNNLTDGRAYRSLNVIDDFNRTMRYELLNQSLFTTIEQAQDAATIGNGFTIMTGQTWRWQGKHRFKH